MKKHDFFDRTALETDKKIQRRTFFSFISFALAGATGIAGWKWLNRQPQQDGALLPLRKTLETNEKILTSTFSEHQLVKTYPVAAAAKNVRVNSLIGTRQNIDVDSWRLNVKKSDGSTMLLSLEDIKRLPKKDIIFDFKCVEGWSQIQHWSGIPLKDFITANGLQDQTKMKYIGLQTPDRKYYVGLDMQSALHPQTMLCYEMNRQPLTQAHGYPLRLIIPVKYGIKNLKCIGTMFFSNQKPPDYWAERGYD
jgi:DMSO/TMAO reductase YedYZ molybdopterin-dependent catalytic subunit